MPRIVPLSSALVVSTAILVAADPPVRVPLQPGLTIVTALSDRAGDYESIKTVEAVSTDAVTLAYSADVPVPGTTGAGGAKARKVSTRRTVRREDLRNAHEYMQIFNPSAPDLIAGTTAIGASAAVLTELKTKGRTAFTFQTPGRQPSADKVLAALTGSSAKDAKSLDDLGKQLDASKASGTLERVEPAAVPFPVLINGRRTTVPAIHARGTFDDVHADFYFLEDADNPIALKWSTGTATGALQVVQISWPEQAAPEIAQALKDSGRAEVHGIYFDFGSATIKLESEPVLKEIADAIGKNPSWQLSIEGHTDNVGGEAANLDLSRKRASAVKDALVARYHIAAGRLATTGFGATRPKEPNETPEGRARNRRVELVRQ
jgi:outer membrane protein OmpA-like peptidoglycan-associated protein